jgi:hypothetical protein
VGAPCDQYVRACSCRPICPQCAGNPGSLANQCTINQAS